MKICLTGGIACGKSLLSHYLNELGVKTLDADDIVHELIPAEERRRLAPIIFNDPAARKELEARIHPQVKERFACFFRHCEPRSGVAIQAHLKLAIIPLLFEVQWDKEYDIIICVVSSRSKQLERMMTTRGYSREEAESRLAAQMDVAEKVKKSNYIIRNDGSEQELKEAAVRLVEWLKKETNHERRT